MAQIRWLSEHMERMNEEIKETGDYENRLHRIFEI